jgi:putative transposase
MKQVNLSYFSYYNKTYGYSGHLWQGRFKSNIIDTEVYLMQCGRYIELNPVRAGIVKLPEEYRFSSYNYYARGIPDRIITTSPAYIGLADSSVQRRKQYIEFVTDNSIINSEKLIKNLFIGSQAFIKKLQDYYGIENEGLKRGRPKRPEGPEK